MEVQVFDVVQLTNDEKAIIKVKEKNIYKVEIINESRKSNNFKIIKEENIEKVLYSKK